MVVNIDKSGQYILEADFRNGTGFCRIKPSEIIWKKFSPIESIAKKNITTLWDKVAIKNNGKDIIEDKFIDENGFLAIKFESASDGDIDILIDDFLIVDANLKNGEFASIETDHLPSGIIKELSSNPSISIGPRTKEKVTTDLHTHYAGAIRTSELIRIAIDANVGYPSFVLNKLGIDTEGLPNEVPLRLLDAKRLDQLKKCMELPQEAQVTFAGSNGLESIYDARRPLTKSRLLAKEILTSIAKDAAENGINYIELSTSDITDTIHLDNNFLSQLDVCDLLEKEYGVKIRFLNMFGRSNDLPYTLDMLDRLVQLKSSKYIAGIDFAGHESNETQDFDDAIRAALRECVNNDAGWTIRVHAGETNTFKDNIKDVVDIAGEFYNPDKPNAFSLRIGHGLNGFDDALLEKMKKIGAIVEINASSNISLNNVNSFDSIKSTARTYIEKGVKIVLGTDGGGIYNTNSIDECQISSARLGFTVSDFEDIRNTENEYLSLIEEREKLKNGELPVYCPPHALNFTKEFENSAQSEVLRKNQALKEALKQKGAEILPWPEISDEKSIKSMLSPFSGKQGIIIAGSSKNHWSKLSTQQQASVKDEIYNLVKNIDSDKFFLITGGTNFGVEKLFHEANLLKTNKIDIIGLVSQKDTNINDILDRSLSHVGVVPGNWWAKGDYQQLLVKHMGGSIKYLAIGGGAIVSDEITSMFLHGHDDKIFLYTGCDGASKDKSTGHSKGLPVRDLTSFISLLQPTQSILKDLNMNANFKPTTTDEIKDLIASGTFTEIKAKKDVSVFARLGKLGEECVTLAEEIEGLVETVNTVKKDGDFIVTNMIDGMQNSYIVSAEKFKELYTPVPEKNGEFKPKLKIDESGRDDKTLYITDRDMQITAPWGSPMFLKAGAALMPDGEGFYGINPKLFKATYRVTEDAVKTPLLDARPAVKPSAAEILSMLKSNISSLEDALKENIAPATYKG